MRIAELCKVLVDHRDVKNFALVGLLVVHSVPEVSALTDATYDVLGLSEWTGNFQMATMKRAAVTSELRGAKWKGRFWPEESFRTVL